MKKGIERSVAADVAYKLKEGSNGLLTNKESIYFQIILMLFIVLSVMFILTLCV